jgi:5'-nucleotidase
MQSLRGQRVLLVNDDGIDAPGIRVLEEVVREFTDDVWVVAPDDERSGAARSLSITVPVRVRQVDDRHFAVRGTPTDCVVLAYHELMQDRPPDVLLSGINRGANLGEDVSYSGTAAAAMEGLTLGMKSVALSLVFTFGGEKYWDTARRHCPAVLDFLLGQPWPDARFYNVNFPDCPPDEVSGMRITRQGNRPPGSFIPERRIDGRDVPYYWIKLNYRDGEMQDGTDLTAVYHKAVSITPMHLDQTDYALRDRLAEQLGAGSAG